MTRKQKPKGLFIHFPKFPLTTDCVISMKGQQVEAEINFLELSVNSDFPMVNWELGLKEGFKEKTSLFQKMRQKIRKLRK